MVVNHFPLVFRKEISKKIVIRSEMEGMMDEAEPSNLTLQSSVA